MIIYALIFLSSLIGIIILEAWKHILPSQAFIWYILFSMILTCLAKILEWSFKKVAFLWRFSETKNKLEAESLYLYANIYRGLPFTTINNLGAGALRHLINLQLIKAEIFPGTLNYIYYLTDLGRKLLEKDLRYTLYPKIFCEIRLLRFWKGYNEKGFKDFDKKKTKFENDYSISWDECCTILREQLKNKGFTIKNDDDDIVKMFDGYYQNKDFSFIMKDLVDPWVLKIQKKKKHKIFRLFKMLK